ncbi:MAG: histone deacetylase [Solirubrobacteraceae bacterium]|jgi:acetoin utilization deacetylase AcuC-like enzyme
MRTWAHDRWPFPLRDDHRYPVAKHRRLRERLLATGVCRPEDLLEAEPLRWSTLCRVQDAALLGRIRRGEMSLREQRGLGLPWSVELVDRARRVSHGTVLAAHEALRAGVAINLGGGSHHAGRDFARGYCLFNDVALARDALGADDLARRVLVVDCDVHQGDGTAQLFAADPDAFTLSLHGARNYPFRRIPSDLDVDLPAGTTDAAYLTALDQALARALRDGGFDIAFYLAGADPWEGDRLGSLALTKAGLRRRDRLVLDVLRGQRIPVCVVLAGGYAPDVQDIVDIHAATAEEVAARTADPTAIEAFYPADAHPASRLLGHP